MLYNVKMLMPFINSLVFKTHFSILLKPGLSHKLAKYRLNKVLKKSNIKFRPKYKPLILVHRKIKKHTFVIKKTKYRFGDLKKKYKKKLFKKVRVSRAKRRTLLNIFVKRNPYILVRKNYKSLFAEFFNGRLLTPLSLDFLHLAYFKLNKDKLYKPRIINKMDSYAKRMYKFTLKNYKQAKLSPYQYFIALMKKTTHYQQVFDLYNKKHRYNIQLHQLFFFQKAKKYDFVKFLSCPDYINPEMGYLAFNKYDALKFHEYKYIQKILNFYYPVTEIHFKETNIHGKPMKTKLPRRV